MDSVGLFSQLGLVAHPEKSVLQPTQSIEILGFVIDSVKMTVKLLPHKVAKTKSMCYELLSKQQPTIREIAQVIGVLVSSFPGVQFGSLHYRNLERDKISALQNNKGNFESPMTLSSWAETELSWWINNIDSAFKPILPDHTIITITTEASTSGWGAVLADSRAGGPWSQHESGSHIKRCRQSYLDLKPCAKTSPNNMFECNLITPQQLHILIPWEA